MRINSRTTLKLVIALTLFCLSGLVYNTAVRAAGVPTTERISIASDGSQANNFSTSITGNPVSGDGRFALFISNAGNLSPGVTHGLYIHDRSTGQTKLVYSSGTGGSISEDGRYVAYATTNGVINLYSVEVGTTQQVSTALGGGLPNGTALAPQISANGKFVVFQSNATNLVPNDMNGQTDIFVLSLETQTISLANISSSGQQANASSSIPQISADGRYVGFSSFATNLSENINNNQNNAFMHDTRSGITQLVDIGPNGIADKGGSVSGVSIDGRYVLLTSNSTNLLDHSIGSLQHTYIRDRVLNITEAEELTGTGSSSPSMSSDARFIEFTSPDSTLVPGDHNNVPDIFVKDRLLGTIERASVDTNAIEQNNSGANTFGVINSTGRYVTFQSASTNLVPGDTNGFLDVFLRDRGASDSVAPSITSTLSPEANSYEWNTTDVTVSFNCTDDTAVASCSGPTTLTSEGANQTVTGTATDTSGNTASTTATVNIDKTAPTINYTVSPSPNANGWNTGDVTVTFNCSDTLSGIDTCTSPVTLSTEGGNQTVTGTATDKAGNTKTVTATVNIDKSAPNINYLETPAPNINGWNQDNVTISFLCDDNVSGIDTCSAPVTVSTEGANQTVNGTAVDKAGNTATVTATVNLDKTAPTISYSASPTANSNNWNNSDVTVSFACDDGLSGIESCSGPTTLSTEGANQQATGTATDKAGNTSTATATVNLDKTAPTITASVSPVSNSDGWNNNDTTVSFTCSDSLSGVDGCPSPVTLTEGAGQIITGTATDKAGNTALTSVMVNVDKTAPVVSNLSWLSNPLQQGQNTTLMATVSDGLSGVKAASYSVNGGASQPMTFDPISGNWIISFGSNLAANTYNITVTATDVADNTSSGTNDILVVYTTANGYVNGHAKALPIASDVLPIAQDTSKNPANLVMGFTNVTAPMSGSFDLDYAVKNKQDEFSLSSTSISWVVVQDSTHSSILGKADMTTYVNGVKTVATNTTVRYDIVLGSNGSADHVSVKIFNPGVDPNTGTPAYTVSDDVIASGSNLMIHP